MQSKKRMDYWDNMKGILIILVVFSHFIFAYKDLGLSKYIVNFIYLFHMPAFITVSGYFSTGKNSSKLSSILKLILIFIIINTLYLLFNIIVSKSISIRQLITPLYSMWYLLALIIWRVITPKLEQYKNIKLISIIISISIGFISFIDYRLALCKIFGFYPFFLLGYKANKKTVNKIIFNKKLIHKVMGVIIILIVLVSSVFLTNLSIINEDVLLMASYNSYNELIGRIAIFVLSGLMIVSLVLLVPNKSLGFITKWGKNSLLIYLGHRIVTLIFAIILPASSYVDLYVFYGFLLSFITLWILGSDFATKIFNKLIDMIFYNKFYNKKEKSIG